MSGNKFDYRLSAAECGPEKRNRPRYPSEEERRPKRHDESESDSESYEEEKQFRMKDSSAKYKKYDKRDKKREKTRKIRTDGSTVVTQQCTPPALDPTTNILKFADGTEAFPVTLLYQFNPSTDKTDGKSVRALPKRATSNVHWVQQLIGGKKMGPRSNKKGKVDTQKYKVDKPADAHVVRMRAIQVNNCLKDQSVLLAFPQLHSAIRCENDFLSETGARGEMFALPGNKEYVDRVFFRSMVSEKLTRLEKVINTTDVNGLFERAESGFGKDKAEGVSITYNTHHGRQIIKLFEHLRNSESEFRDLPYIGEDGKIIKWGDWNKLVSGILDYYGGGSAPVNLRELALQAKFMEPVTASACKIFVLVEAHVVFLNIPKRIRRLNRSDGYAYGDDGDYERQRGVFTALDYVARGGASDDDDDRVI